jgi:hypothetical protein
MTHRSSGHMVAGALVLAIAMLSAMPAGGAQNRGRYKKQGDTCVWDANDSGPNQCTPQTKGRFKKSGDACVWNADDTGADQCRPKTGRFKKSGDKCEWDAKDSGPDQCNPRRAK